MRKAMVLVLLLLVPVAAYADAVDFWNVATIDTTANGLNLGFRPGSVAFNGTDLYIGQPFVSAANGVARVGDPLGTPSVLSTFGGAFNGNGVVSLDVHGQYVVAASNNAGANDVAEIFQLDGTSVARKLASGLGAYQARIDGAGLDPGWVGGGGGGAGVTLTAYGNGKRNLYDYGLNPLDNSAMFYNAGLGSGFRDVHYDAATGDVYLRALNGIGVGKRVGNHNFQTLTGAAGTQLIVGISDGSNSAINVDFLPSWGGLNLVIGNWRGPNGGSVFSTRNKVFRADAVNTQVTANWKNLDGSVFTTALADTGWYDFSYDPSSGLLAVSDYSMEKIYFFSQTPEPASLALLALAAGLLRRR